MAFEGLTEKLSSAFKKLRGKGRLSEADVKEAMREIRMALLEADVNFKVVKDFVAKVTERAVDSDVLESLTPAQMVTFGLTATQWHSAVIFYFMCCSPFVYYVFYVHAQKNA